MSGGVVKIGQTSSEGDHRTFSRTSLAGFVIRPARGKIVSMNRG